jgi:hypothetical protein
MEATNNHRKKHCKHKKKIPNPYWDRVSSRKQRAIHSSSKIITGL